MEWNETSTLQWDWENQGLFSGSELGNNSSKSSISASLDSSSKSLIEDLHKGLNKGNDMEKVEPIIGLKLGKRTYFEDVCAGNSEKNKNLTTSVVPTAPAKKSRASQQISVVARCQVEGCNVDLSAAKDYHRKHRVCDVHSKCPKVVVTGQERRFCQQCSRFHSLLEFDHKKRSCRRRLSDHNARRRKPQAETITFNSSSYSSPFYDERQQMSFLMNRAPFSIMRQSARTLWEDSSSLSLARSNGSWINKSKVEGMEEEHVRYSSSGISNSMPLHALDVDKLIPFRSATHEILGTGIDACVPVSNLDRSALSLLSTDSSWGSPHLGQSNLPPFINANHHHHHNHHHRHHNSNLNGYWKDQPTLAQEAHPHQRLPFENHNNELAGTQYGTSFFDSSTMASKANSPFLV